MAFETIDRKILLRKLKQYGIKGVAFRFYRNYLDGRKQHYVNMMVFLQRMKAAVYEEISGSVATVKATVE
jgi:hypothetical protein